MSFQSVSDALDFNRDIYSVARLASEVRAVLEGSFPLLWVRGELSNLA
ncbi:MAG: exodeoxyribonuclease VII large subunit, partial [Chromatiaceae bacterium]